MLKFKKVFNFNIISIIIVTSFIITSNVYPSPLSFNKSHLRKQIDFNNQGEGTSRYLCVMLAYAIGASAFESKSGENFVPQDLDSIKVKEIFEKRGLNNLIEEIEKNNIHVEIDRKGNIWVFHKEDKVYFQVHKNGKPEAKKEKDFDIAFGGSQGRLGSNTGIGSRSKTKSIIRKVLLFGIAAAILFTFEPSKVKVREAAIPEYSLILPGALKPLNAKPRTPGEALPGLYGNAGIVGGIGTGSISRTRDGRMANFTFSACPVLESFPEGQVSIYIRKGNKTFATPLGIKLDGDPRLPTWNWSGARKVSESATYAQSYPFSFWQYPVSEDLPVSVTFRRFSPFIPGDLEASTEPVSINEITITNPADEEIEISIMVSKPNIVGYELKESPDNAESYVFSKNSEKQKNILCEDSGYIGIILDADDEKDPRLYGQTALVTNKEEGVTVTYAAAFGAEKGEKEWNLFSAKGELPNTEIEKLDSKEQAGAIAIKLKLKPGETKTISAAFAWDFPIDVRNGKQFYRYHTRRYGAEGDDAFRIASRALQNREQRSVKISKWQEKILRNPDIPSEAKTMLINELYYLVQGGSLLTSQGEPYFLESIVYRIHNTLDVWFYTPMLAATFPELEKEFIRMHSRLVSVTDNRKVDYFNIYAPEYGFPGDERLSEAFKVRKGFDITQRYPGPLKPGPGVVHHVDDIMFGPIVENPDLDGGTKTDINRRWQNHNPWKDLNPKFVLMAWRAFFMDGSKDIDFLREVWLSIKIALERQKEFDKDGDGLPEHEGYPDQTYDTWSITGPCIMTADLTMASLRAAIEIAQLLGDHQLVNDYQSWLDRAAKSTEKLYKKEEGYFKVSEQSDDIMADAFPGTLYLQLFGLKPVISSDKINSHLRKVYDFNFKRFAGGKIGVINAMTSEGKSIGELGGDIQRDEVWLGTQRSVAALMMFYGMEKQAWEILKVDFVNSWNGEYANMIPEAIDVNGDWRSLVYMRAGAIYNVLLASDKIAKPPLRGINEQMKNHRSSENNI